MVFVPFLASRERDRWLRRFCQTYYFPLLECVSLADAANWIGEGCQPEGLRPLAEGLPATDRVAADDPRKFTIHTRNLRRLAEAWWSQVPATVAQLATQTHAAELRPSAHSDASEATPVPAREIPDWQKEWELGS